MFYSTLASRKADLTSQPCFAAEFHIVVPETLERTAVIILLCRQRPKSQFKASDVTARDRQTVPQSQKSLQDLASMCLRPFMRAFTVIYWKTLGTGRIECTTG